MEYYDVCVICALPEEATAFIEVLKTHGTQPEDFFIPDLKRAYYRANILNTAGETLNIAITWLPDMGIINAIADFGRFLEHFPIRFAAMTGICAGNKDKVKLGDLIIASSTYLFDGGSYVSNDEGESEHKWNVQNIQTTNDILHTARMFTKWEDEARKIPRPLSRHQQRDWLLYTLFKENKTVDGIDITMLKKYAPDWRKIVYELQQGLDPFLDDDATLIRPERVKKLLRGPVDFPYEDPSEPAHYIAPMASGNAVRKDNPFAEITVPVSKALALDMESMAFYSILQNYDNIRALLVKGVCDYADKEKDDSYHAYASTISAVYMYAFIKEFVTNERIPWPAGKNPGQTTAVQQAATPPAKQIIPEEKTVSSNESDKRPIKVFSASSESPKDKELIDELNKQFSFMTKRSKSIENWDIHNISPGMSQTTEVEKHLREAQIIILLLTPDYINSDFYDQETPLIEERYNNGAKVIPIILRPISDDWKDTFYGGLQVLPRSGPSAVTLWKNRDEVLKNIVDEIRAVVKSLS